ncbi:unnamed protein product [Lampetra fluviatilis]
MPSSALVVADMERVVPGAGAPSEQHRAALQMALEKISLMALGDTERAVLYGDGGVGVTDDGSCESDHSGDNMGSSSNGNNNNGGGGGGSGGGGASNGNNGCGAGGGVNNNSNSSSRRGGNTTECVCVPSSEHVAEIVGRQGCKIKALRAKTNTYIKTPVRGEEPVFVITGRPEDVCMAKQEILSAAEHFSVLRAFRNKPPGPALGPGPNPQSLATAAGGGAAAGGAVGAAQLQPPPAVPGQTTIQVRVPYRVVGLVVGPKGATIRRIQQATHTYIVTPSREREPVFEVTGLPHNVERAREEIESHIAARTGSLLEFCGGAGGVDGESDFHVNGMDVGFEYGAGGGGGGGYQPGSLWLRLPRKPLFAAPSRNDSSSSLGSVSSDSRVGGAAGFGLVDAAEGAAAAAAAALGSRADEPGLWAQLERANPIAAALGGLPHHPGRERAASASGCGSSSSAAPSASSASGGAEHHPSARRVRSDPLQAMVAHGLPGFLSAEWSLGLLRRGGPGAPASPGEQQQQQGQLRECAVCRESAVTAALVPCGHKLFCMECASGICHENDPKCPVCLTSVTQAIRIFS